MKVLLLGAGGYVGRRCASEFLRHPEIQQLTLAGRNGDVVQRMADRMQGRADVSAASFDLAGGGLAEHARNHDLIVSCAGPGYQIEALCVQGALEAGVSYISLNDDLSAAHEVRQLHEAARAQGVTILSGCGASPGLTDLLVALATDELDEVEEVEISFGASSADGGGPATDLHFLAMLDRAARDGVEREGGSRAPHPVYFPDPVGWIETFPCGHPEEISIAAANPGLTAFRYQIGLAEKAVMDVVRAGIAARLTRGEFRRKLWLKSARPLRPALEMLSPKAAPWTGLRTDVRGRKGGRSKTISYGIVDHLESLASITLAQAAVDLPGGQTSGVVSAAEVLEPKAFLRKVAARGLTFARLEAHNF